MDIIKPYFMINELWYYYDEENSIKLKNGDAIIIKLTPLGKSIPKVVRSYNDYIKDYTSDDLDCEKD